MKALLQRVTRASVEVAGEIVGSIGQGLVVMVGVAEGDEEADARYLAEKIANLRVFLDAEGRFNLSSLDAMGEILVVSQFTLLARTRKGRRPSFSEAAPPAKAENLINSFTDMVRSAGLKVETGRFQQHMLVNIQNDGPVTLMLDSRERFEPR